MIAISISFVRRSNIMFGIPGQRNQNALTHKCKHFMENEDEETRQSLFKRE